MPIQIIIFWAGMVAATSLSVISIYGDIAKDQEAKRLFTEVSSMVDQYRTANCSTLPSSISVGALFTAQGSSAPVGVSGWNVTFSKGWASIVINTLDAQDRSSLLGRFDGSQSGGVATVTVPLRHYATHNVTALNDRMTMEGSYRYECY